MFSELINSYNNLYFSICFLCKTVPMHQLSKQNITNHAVQSNYANFVEIWPCCSQCSQQQPNVIKTKCLILMTTSEMEDTSRPFAHRNG